MTALLVAFAWVSTSDSASKKKQKPTPATESFWSEPKTPVSLSSRSKGLIYYGSRNLPRERWWLCVHNVHVWLTSCLCTESKEQDVSRPVESKGRGSCECDCVPECRVGGMWGRLSSPAYRSTKDNLTLPLGSLPRLPTWHSFYVLLYRCCLFISLSCSPKYPEKCWQQPTWVASCLLPGPFRGERFM